MNSSLLLCIASYIRVCFLWLGTVIGTYASRIGMLNC